MQIDHDPRELPHRAWKIVAIVTAVVTIAIGIPMMFGIRWIVDQMSETVIIGVGCAFLGFAAGYYLGEYQSAKPGKDG